MTHCTSTAVALRFVCSAGSATFTTVPSMNAMLDARMVAARTQRPRDFSHGAVAAPERTTFSSQGSRKSAHICANSVFAKCVFGKAIQPAFADVRATGHWFLTRASARCFLTVLGRCGQCNLHAGDGHAAFAHGSGATFHRPRADVARSKNGRQAGL